MKEQPFYVNKFQTILGLVFAAIAVVLFVFVWYVLWARVTIVLHTAQEAISREFFVQVSQEPSSEQVAEGRVFAVPISVSERFKASGSKEVEQEEGIVGEVVIRNSYSRDQTLVETTRLAYSDDPDTVIARLRTTVTVRAGESLSVPVYFDRPEEQTVVRTGTLIIPGLWGVLKDYIVAEVTEPLQSGARTVSVVQDEDIALARTQLEERLIDQALNTVDDELGGAAVLWPKVVGQSSLNYSFSSQSGDVASEFTVTVDGQIPIVVVNENDLYRVLRDSINNEVGGEQQIVGINEDSTSYAIESISTEDSKASLRVTVSASAIGAHDSELRDSSAILGKSTDEVFEYYEQFPSITSVDIHFSPSWLKKIPRIRDKITIEFTN